MNTLTDLVGDWENFFLPIFSNKKIVTDLNLVNLFYRNSETTIEELPTTPIYPKKSDVFKAFKECPYNKLSVVILGQDPYHDGSATGLAFANNLGRNLSPSLRIIKDTISKTIHKGSDFDFDPSLISWARQGVLMLNTTLTVEKGKPGSHKLLWENFTKEFLRLLSEKNSGIIYCLWGDFAKAYLPNINSFSNTILTYTHPAYSLYRGVKWDCNHFSLINEQLHNFNNYTIKW